MTIEELFQNPTDCCGLYASDLQQLIAEYYYRAQYCMFPIADRIYAAEIFGKPTENLYNYLNDFQYLLGLLIIIHYERLDDIAWSDDGEDLGADYYYEKHNLQCIRRNFMCKGCDIVSLLRVFNLDPDGPEDLDGINYMHITTAPLQHNVFRVR